MKVCKRSFCVCVVRKSWKRCDKQKTKLKQCCSWLNRSINSRWISTQDTQKTPTRKNSQCGSLSTWVVWRSSNKLACVCLCVAWKLESKNQICLKRHLVFLLALEYQDERWWGVKRMLKERQTDSEKMNLSIKLWMLGAKLSKRPEVFWNKNKRNLTSKTNRTRSPSNKTYKKKDTHTHTEKKRELLGCTEMNLGGVYVGVSGVTAGKTWLQWKTRPMCVCVWERKREKL